MLQNKFQEAEKKYKQIQEQLEEITLQVQELQPKSAKLKAEAHKRNKLFKSCEVREQKIWSHVVLLCLFLFCFFEGCVPERFNEFVCLVEILFSL